MDTGLRGKTALITGGSTGIGRGIASVLADEGVHLAIASRNPDERFLAEIREKGVRCIGVAADVSMEDQVVDMVNQAIREFGELDFYINNAAWTWHQPVTGIDTESWQRTLDTNLSACVWACREVAKHMIPRKKGSILIIGSTSRFNPSYTETAYRISKMGLKMYMENLALELAPYGIRTNMITPGHFKTRLTAHVPPQIEDQLRDLIPAQRFGDPCEIGNAAALLLSDQLSGYTYGSDLVIDGGLVLRPFPFMTKQEIHNLNTQSNG